MNDIYALDMSKMLAKVVDAGMLELEAIGDGWIFYAPMCAAHLMVNLPKCLMCIEAERDAVSAAA
jgi:hypothetical protein